MRALRCSRSRVHFAFLPSLSPRRLCVGSMQSIQSGYLTRASVILVLCMFDCCINAVADHPSRGAESFMPYVFLGVQVALQVINLLLIFMLFSGTYLFQVGLVGVQVREFRGLLGCALLYLLVYIAYAAYKIVRARCRAPPLLPPGAPSFHPLRPLPPQTPPRLALLAAEPHTQRGRGWPVGRARLCLSVPHAKAGVAPLLLGHAGHLQPHGRDSVVQPRELDSKVQRGHVRLAGLAAPKARGKAREGVTSFTHFNKWLTCAH